jgi:ribosomal protein S18 acetylase RimI-like enzyme
MEIQAMEPAMLADLVPISEQVGWGDLRPQFSFFLTRPECWPFAAIDGGHVIGTGVGIGRGPVGWIGMITVREEHRSKGVGRAMTEHVAVQLERSGCRSLVLLASDAGRPLYEKLGFETVGLYGSFEGPSLGYLPRHDRLRPLMPPDLAAVKALDREATGEDRSLDIDGCGRTGWVMVDRGTGLPAAYHLSTPWGGGPIIARDPEDGRVLLDLTRALVGQVGRQTAQAVVPEANEPACRYLERAGFHVVKRLTRMVRGEPVPWEPGMIWGRFSGAMG